MRVRVQRFRGAHRVVAGEDVAAGDVLLRLEGVVVGHPTQASVQLAEGEHLVVPPDVAPERVITDYPWRYLNHACEPTARVEGRCVIALRDLRSGDEITFDYDSTEADLAVPFRCRCGAGACRGGWVRGYRHAGAASRSRARRA